MEAGQVREVTGQVREVTGQVKAKGSCHESETHSHVQHMSSGDRSQVMSGQVRSKSEAHTRPMFPEDYSSEQVTGQKSHS